MALTMRDLYPRHEWNFIEGFSDTRCNVGVVSLGRHAEHLGLRLTKEKKYLRWLQRSLPTITREICYNMGMQNCIYYECKMNGTNS